MSAGVCMVTGVVVMGACMARGYMCGMGGRMQADGTHPTGMLSCKCLVQVLALQKSALFVLKYWLQKSVTEVFPTCI